MPARTPGTVRPPKPAKPEIFPVAVLTVGDEVLAGRTPDTNFVHLSRALTDCGAEVVWHASCRDVVEEMAEALRVALRRARLVVVTGGLGPTPDDLTRKAVALVVERPLVLHDGALAEIRARFAARGSTMLPSHEVQALLPSGAQMIPNARGTAPGFLVPHGTQHVAAMPGVPWEAEAMTDAFLVPWVRERTGGGRTGHLVLRTAGITESGLAELLKGFEKTLPEGATLAYLPHGTGVDLRVSLRGAPPEIEAQRATVRAALMAAAGDFVYAEEAGTLEQMVGELLRLRGLKLASAESCTGGLLGGRITRVPGSSEWFERGVIAYSNRAKTELLGISEELLAAHGAVSAEVAAAMAQGVRERSGTDLGLGVTGIAGPGGGTPEKPVGLVYVGLDWGAGVAGGDARRGARAAAPAGGAVRQLRLAGERELVRERAVTIALDMVRRLALGLPLEP
ncbi:MAG TPA: CinA family nicotinamide mononucleotide deamidase-related protein [Candidatus Saccharimonadales bacterium]|nr:CinA family nicotinamide mononucleotide deamidase-related protein [Candidatus Saccharimonadales bacterium]